MTTTAHRRSSNASAVALAVFIGGPAFFVWLLWAMFVATAAYSAVVASRG